jgi:hypothetical protein
VIVLGDSLRDS